MTKSAPEDSPVAIALRAAGFVPCPRWWLTPDQMDLLAYMARQNEEHVNEIRAEANRKRQIDAAWSANQDSE